MDGTGARAGAVAGAGTARGGGLCGTGGAGLLGVWGDALGTGWGPATREPSPEGAHEQRPDPVPVAAVDMLGVPEDMEPVPRAPGSHAGATDPGGVYTSTHRLGDGVQLREAVSDGSGVGGRCSVAEDASPGGAAVWSQGDVHGGGPLGNGDGRWDEGAGRDSPQRRGAERGLPALRAVEGEQPHGGPQAGRGLQRGLGPLAGDARHQGGTGTPGHRWRDRGPRAGPDVVPGNPPSALRMACAIHPGPDAWKGRHGDPSEEEAHRETERDPRSRRRASPGQLPKAHRQPLGLPQGADAPRERGPVHPLLSSVRRAHHQRHGARNARSEPTHGRGRSLEREWHHEPRSPPTGETTQPRRLRAGLEPTPETRLYPDVLVLMSTKFHATSLELLFSDLHHPT